MKVFITKFSRLSSHCFLHQDPLRSDLLSRVLGLCDIRRFNSCVDEVQSLLGSCVMTIG